MVTSEVQPTLCSPSNHANRSSCRPFRHRVFEVSLDQRGRVEEEMVGHARSERSSTIFVNTDTLETRRLIDLRSVGALACRQTGEAIAQEDRFGHADRLVSTIGQAPIRIADTRPRSVIISQTFIPVKTPPKNWSGRAYCLNLTSTSRNLRLYIRWPNLAIEQAPPKCSRFLPTRWSRYPPYKTSSG